MANPSTSLLTATLALTSSGPALASEWELDPAHTTAQFSVRHLMVSTVRGQFEKVTGMLKLDEQDLTRSSVEIAIDAGSINTREPKRDAHLRSPDFFDVARNPTITFKSTKIEKRDHGAFRAIGDLTMRGVTRPVTLLVDAPPPAVKGPSGRMVRGVSATGKLNRKDWGLNWNMALETGGVLVSDEVQLQIDAELVSRAAATN